MFLHLLDATIHGHTKVMIRTVDSDVMVLAIAALQQIRIDELWIVFSQPMIWQLTLALRNAKHCFFCTHSVYVTLYRHLLVVVKRLFGTYGMYLMKLHQQYVP